MVGGVRHIQWPGQRVAELIEGQKMGRRRCSPKPIRGFGSAISSSNRLATFQCISILQNASGSRLVYRGVFRGPLHLAPFEGEKCNNI